MAEIKDLVLQNRKTNPATQSLDSRLVAEMVEKRHDHLMRDIDTYIVHIGDAPNFGAVDFFIESTYQDAKGETRKCYLVTKKGCELIANKMTGAKGIRFTAAYVTKFNDMERGRMLPETEAEARLIRARAMETNANTRAYKAIMATIGDKGLSPIAVQLFGLNAIEGITGQHIDHRPATEKHWTATEIALECGVSPQQIGRLSEKNHLKTADNGIWAMDKSPHSSKQVESFRYNERGRAILIALVKGVS